MEAPSSFGNGGGGTGCALLKINSAKASAIFF